MTLATNSSIFSPRLEAHGVSGTVVGSPLFIARTLPGQTSPLTTNVTSGYYYCQSYNFDTSADAAGNFRDTRNFYTQTSLSEYFTITLPTDITTPFENVLLYVDKRPAGAVYSQSNQPSRAADLAEHQLYATYASTDSIWVLNGSTYDLTFQLDWNLTFGSKPAWNIVTLVKNRLWNGRLNICLDMTNASTRVITHPTGTRVDTFAYGQYVPAWSGWDGRPASRGRPVLDMKTGLPSFAEDLVEDGYLDGIWTVASQADPLDPRDLRDVVFPDDEGTRKDDVPA